MHQLRLAVDRVRAERGPGDPCQPAPPAGAWSALPDVTVDPAALARRRLVAWQSPGPAAASYELLRRRLAARMAAERWQRIAVAAPRGKAGATLTSANLALALARCEGQRTLLLDLDFGRPQLARLLGLESPPRSLSAWLVGTGPVEEHFQRLGTGLALGLESRPADADSGLTEEPEAAERLAAAIGALGADTVICDCPPLLSGTGLAALGSVDAVLLVARAGRTTTGDIAECRRLIEGVTGFAGVVLNGCSVLS